MTNELQVFENPRFGAIRTLEDWVLSFPGISPKPSPITWA